MIDGPIKTFIKHNYRHFNSAVIVDASEAWIKHLEQGNKMLLTLAGAMSTAELGISIAELIRQDKIHAISCTGANLEEDVFNLVAHDHYIRVPHYRDLTPQQEVELLNKGMNRVTDTCIPEMEAMRRLEKKMNRVWQKAHKDGVRKFPHEFLFELIRSGELKEFYQIDPKDSWMVAACEKNIPIFVPGWEDSTLGNICVSQIFRGEVKDLLFIRSGVEYMEVLAKWYRETTAKNVSLGFFQIGGGIAGDFPICVVPMIRQDLQDESCKLWGYFCQISDSTTSYGSYSGAVPNEKITWEKLDVDTPKFIIESDATIVAPLVFNYVLNK